MAECAAIDRAILRLASHALKLAIAGQIGPAGRVVGRLAAEHGGQAVWIAMQGWSDTFLVEAGVEGGTDTPVALAFFDNESGRVGMADEVPASVAWAGRFIAARAAGDRATCEALFRSVGSSEERAACVGALLTTCALNIRALHDGTYPGTTTANPRGNF